MPQFKLIEIIGVLLAVVALIGAVIGAYKLVDSKGYARGSAEANEKWQKRESAELAAANATILILTDKARKAEQAAAKTITAANDKRRKDDAKAKEQISAAVATVRGNLASMCNDTGTATGKNPGSGATGSIAAAADRPDGASQGGLRAAFADFLVGEADRADQYARKIMQFQALVGVYLETCNSP